MDDQWDENLMCVNCKILFLVTGKLMKKEGESVGLMIWWFLGKVENTTFARLKLFKFLQANLYAIKSQVWTSSGTKFWKPCNWQIV